MRPGRVDGNHVVRAYPEGDFNVVQAAEIAEMQCPVRIEQYGLREDFVGDGEYRGGCGMRRDIRVLVDGASLSVLADHAVIPPFGVAGGRSGAANRFVVIRDGEVIEPSPVPGKVGGFKLKIGDIVRVESSGGGGYGDPIRRDPVATSRTMSISAISVVSARARCYGVAPHAGRCCRRLSPRTVSAAACPLHAIKSPSIDAAPRMTSMTARRWIGLSKAQAARLGLAHGDLIELVNPHGAAALRGWVRFIDWHRPAMALDDSTSDQSAMPCSVHGR